MRLRLGYPGGGRAAAALAWAAAAAVTFWALWAAAMPALVPALSPWTYGWMAAVGTVGLIVSLFLQAAVAGAAARRIGAAWTRAAVLPFGPMPEPVASPGGWKRELLAALVAALASTALGVLLLLLVFQGSGTQTPLAVVGTGFFLGLANLGLALVAVLPIYPLPGGRPLLALLARRMPPHGARRTAALPAYGLGAAAAVLGLWGFSSGAVETGAWLFCFGLLVAAAARGASR